MIGIRKFFYGLLLLSALFSCADAGRTSGGPNSGLGVNPTDPPDNNPPAGAQSVCSLDGQSFERCTSNGLLGSTREILSFDGENLNRTVETYLLSSTCNGLPSLIEPVTSALNLGAIGGSDSLPGLTDLDLNADVDLGCGTGLPIFTTLHLSDDCSQLALAQTPSCDPDARSTSLDLNLFDRSISVQ